jgi:molybdate transport system permease protein
MSDAVLVPLLLSLKVAITATLLAMLLGIAAGFALARLRFPGRETVDAILLLPMVLPPTVLGYYLLVALGRASPLGAWLEDSLGIRLVFTWQGAAAASAVVAFPLVFKGARAAFESIEPNLEKAGRALGYGAFAVFARITLPLAWRAIAAGAMLAFARALGEFGATLMVAGNIPGRTQTLSLAIYEAVQAGEDRRANELVLVASLACVALLVAGAHLVRRGHLRAEAL